MKAPIVLAVDTPNLDIAKQWVASTQESVSVYKLGLEFFLSFGHDGVRAIQSETDADIFLDLKLHDIPHTVEGAARAIAALSPKYLTVHASGGRAMIKTAVDAVPGTDITAVTILTSLSEEDLFDSMSDETEEKEDIVQVHDGEYDQEDQGRGGYRKRETELKEGYGWRSFFKD